MPPVITMPRRWPREATRLLELGAQRAAWFCQLNELPIPTLTPVNREDWPFDACAYYRPITDDLKLREQRVKHGVGTGIMICLTHCGTPCGEATSRNWSWPGNTTDREPYGVVCHELGHHCDWYASERKGRYFGDYGVKLRQQSGEPAISGYCPNDAEWFAEHMRLFITNPGLLRCLRPRTYALICQRFKPLGTHDWQQVLGCNVPERVVKSLLNKGAK